jgi:hypothetical protein
MSLGSLLWVEWTFLGVCPFSFTKEIETDFVLIFVSEIVLLIFKLGVH